MGRLRDKHVTPALLRREYGTSSNTWLGLRILGCVLSGPSRSWRQVLHIKENSLIEVAEDLVWVTNPSAPATERGCSVMQRIGMDGKRLRLYRAPLQPRLKEHLIYDLPSTIYDKTLPDNEYRHVMLMLRKGNLLTRHDLCTGTLYDTLQLSPNLSYNSLMWSPTQDLLAIKSIKVKPPDQIDCCFHYQIFNLHPFGKLTSFIIHGMHFPADEDKNKYGKLRDTEIHEGLLLIITEKSHVLLYNVDEVIAQSRNNTSFHSDESSSCHSNLSALVTAPALLFATWVHQDILSIGARFYIRAVNDSMLEVRDLGSQELIRNGQVNWGDFSDQQISPDYLLFHPDDSNRVIHTRSRDIRVLAVKDDEEGQPYLEEEFRYSNYRDDKTSKRISQFSRSGRLLKTTFVWDDSFNEAVTYDIDRDMDIFAVLEARRDTEHNCSIIKKVTMFDSQSYEVKSEVIINMSVDGDIETNRMALFVARDTMSIVINGTSGKTLLMYRLTENFQKGKNKESTRTNKIREEEFGGQGFTHNKYMKRSRKTRTMESDDEYIDDQERRNIRSGLRLKESDEEYVEQSPKRNRRVGRRFRESDEEYVADKEKRRGKSQPSGTERDESRKKNISKCRRKKTKKYQIVDGDMDDCEETNTVSEIKDKVKEKNENNDEVNVDDNSTPSTSNDNRLIRIRGWGDADDGDENENENEDDDENDNYSETEREILKNRHKIGKDKCENLSNDTEPEENVSKRIIKIESDEDYIPPSISNNMSYEDINEKFTDNSNTDTNDKRKKRTKRKRKVEDDYNFIPSSSKIMPKKCKKNSDDNESDISDNSLNGKRRKYKDKSNAYLGDDVEPSTSRIRTRKLEIRWWGEDKDSSEDNSTDTRYSTDSDFDVKEFEKGKSKRKTKVSDSDLEDETQKKRPKRRKKMKKKKDSDSDYN